MKKLIPVLLAGLLLAGCGHTVDVGIIGGADGPAAIVVGNRTETTVCTEMPDFPGIPVPPGTFAEGWEGTDSGMIYVKTIEVSESSFRTYTEETLPAAGYTAIPPEIAEDAAENRMNAVLCQGKEYSIQLLYTCGEETLTVMITPGS